MDAYAGLFPAQGDGGLNQFRFLRYVWDRFVARAAHYNAPMDVSQQVFALKAGRSVKLYSCAAVVDAPDLPLGVTLHARYVVGSARQLEALEALEDAQFRARFAAECVVSVDVTLDSVLRSFAPHMRDPQFAFRLAAYRKLLLRAAAQFQRYDRLLAEAGADGGAVFADNSRDSLGLLEQEGARMRASRQSLERSDEHFFDADAQLGQQEVEQMLRRYRPYWESLLNDPGASVTQPQVFDIAESLNDADMWRRLGQILFEEFPRFVLKAARASRDRAEDIVHEIRCAYHLNELNLGYAHVLTPHFMQIADWFCARDEYVPQRPPRTREERAPDQVYQFTVCEKLDYSIARSVCGGHGLEGLRAHLFQIMLTLEVAWLANQYVHYDLHTGNVFLKVLRDDSLLYGRDLYYRRFNDDQAWYCLEAAVLDNRLIKLLDYGRNRMYVPATTTVEEGAVHRHDRLLFQPGREAYGITRAPNRCWDARWLCLELLKYLTEDEIEALERHADFGALCEMMDQVLDLASFARLRAEARARDGEEDEGPEDRALSTSIASFIKVRHVLMVHPNRRGTSEKTATRMRDYFEEYKYHVAWSTYDSGATPTTLLNTRFFAPLKREQIDHPDRSVVVSFPTAELLQTEMPTDDNTSLGSSVQLAETGCAVCGKRARKRSDYQGERLDWCGPLCYQFHYQHARLSCVH